MSALQLQQRPRLAAQVRLRIDPITGDPVLLFPEGLLVLNDTSHEIVRRCDGRTSIAEIIQALTAEFEATEEILLGDVLENLDQLRQRSLLHFDP